MRQPITTATEAIKALGGTRAVAALFGIDQRVVLNWHERGLPPDTYAVMGPALTYCGYKFPLRLFQQREAVISAAEALATETRPYHRNGSKRVNAPRDG